MLRRRVLKPILSAVAVDVFRLNACGGIPVGTLPAKRLTMAGTDHRESVMDGGFAHTATGFILAIGIMRGVEQTEALADP